MEITSYLSDVYGPRLTGSPNIRKAGEWAIRRCRAGASPTRSSSRVGPFGRGWSNDRFVAHMTAPATATLIGYPKAWTPGTNGPIKAEAIFAALNSDRDLDNFRGKLKGKFVLTSAARPVTPHFEPEGRRYTDDELAARREQRGWSGRPRGRAWRSAAGRELRDQAHGVSRQRRRRRHDRAGPRRRRHRASCSRAARETQRIRRPFRRS